MFSSISSWWHDINHCQFCGKNRETTFSSSLFTGTPEESSPDRLVVKLAKAQEIHDYKLLQFNPELPVCGECITLRLEFRCSVTKQLFPARKNKIVEFRKSLETILTPLAKFSDVKNYISPDGFDMAKKESDRISLLLHHGIKRSRRGFIYGHRIVEYIRSIQTFRRVYSIGEAESQLDLLTAQVGGNAYIDFFWERHDESWDERVIAGYSERGNPYYRTVRHRITEYSATCIAVIVERSRKQSGAQSKPGPGGRQYAQRDKPMDYAEAISVLGLQPGFTAKDLSAAFRHQMALNHPDKVSHLSPEIRAVAEARTKKINAAYSLLRR